MYFCTYLSPFQFQHSIFSPHLSPLLLALLGEIPLCVLMFSQQLSGAGERWLLSPQVTVQWASSARGGHGSLAKLLHHRAAAFFFFSVAKYCKVMPRDTCLTCCYFFSPKSVFILWTLWGEVIVTESTFWIKHFVQKLDKDSQKGRLLHVRWISHLLLCGKMFSLSPCQMSLP